MKIHSIAVLAFLLFFLSCSTETKKSQEEDSSLVHVSVVNYPLYYFAKTIGGEFVSVYLPSIAGDPAYWKPDARQVMHFQKSDLIFINGAGYAKWIEKVSLPTSKVYNTSLAFKEQWIETEEEVVHSHGSEGEHSHMGTAFTTWLNFSFAALQAQVIYKELARMLPDYKSQLQKNYDTLHRSLIELDEKAKQSFDRIKGYKIMASHPVYQYLSSAYDIEMVSMHWEPDEMPTKDMWLDLGKSIGDQNVHLMLWEGEPIDDIKSGLKEMNIIASVFDPCANKPKEGDFMDIMTGNLARLNVSVNSYML